MRYLERSIYQQFRVSGRISESYINTQPSPQEQKWQNTGPIQDQQQQHLNYNNRSGYKTMSQVQLRQIKQRSAVGPPPSSSASNMQQKCQNSLNLSIGEQEHLPTDGTFAAPYSIQSNVNEQQMAQYMSSQDRSRQSSIHMTQPQVSQQLGNSKIASQKDQSLDFSQYRKTSVRNTTIPNNNNNQNSSSNQRFNYTNRRGEDQPHMGQGQQNISQKVTQRDHRNINNNQTELFYKTQQMVVSDNHRRQPSGGGSSTECGDKEQTMTRIQHQNQNNSRKWLEMPLSTENSSRTHRSYLNVSKDRDRQSRNGGLNTTKSQQNNSILKNEESNSRNNEYQHHTADQLQASSKQRMSPQFASITDIAQPAAFIGDQRSNTPYLGSINHDEDVIVAQRPDTMGTHQLLIMTDSSIAPLSNDAESQKLTKRSGTSNLRQTITLIDQSNLDVAYRTQVANSLHNKGLFEQPLSHQSFLLQQSSQNIGNSNDFKQKLGNLKEALSNIKTNLTSFKQSASAQSLLNRRIQNAKFKQDNPHRSKSHPNLTHGQESHKAATSNNSGSRSSISPQPRNQHNQRTNQLDLLRHTTKETSHLNFSELNRSKNNQKNTKIYSPSREDTEQSNGESIEQVHQRHQQTSVQLEEYSRLRKEKAALAAQMRHKLKQQKNFIKFDASKNIEPLDLAQLDESKSMPNMPKMDEHHGSTADKIVVDCPYTSRKNFLPVTSKVDQMSKSSKQQSCKHQRTLSEDQCKYCRGGATASSVSRENNTKDDDVYAMYHNRSQSTPVQKPNHHHHTQRNKGRNQHNIAAEENLNLMYQQNRRSTECSNYNSLQQQQQHHQVSRSQEEMLIQADHITQHHLNPMTIDSSTAVSALQSGRTNAVDQEEFQRQHKHEQQYDQHHHHTFVRSISTPVITVAANDKQYIDTQSSIEQQQNNVNNLEEVIKHQQNRIHHQNAAQNKNQNNDMNTQQRRYRASETIFVNQQLTNQENKNNILAAQTNSTTDSQERIREQTRREEIRIEQETYQKMQTLEKELESLKESLQTQHRENRKILQQKDNENQSLSADLAQVSKQLNLCHKENKILKNQQESQRENLNHKETFILELEQVIEKLRVKALKNQQHVESENEKLQMDLLQTQELLKLKQIGEIELKEEIAATRDHQQHQQQNNSKEAATSVQSTAINSGRLKGVGDERIETQILTDLLKTLGADQKHTNIEHLLRKLKKQQKFIKKISQIVSDIEGRKTDSLTDCLYWVKGLLKDFIQLRKKLQEMEASGPPATICIQCQQISKNVGINKQFYEEQESCLSPIGQTSHLSLLGAADSYYNQNLTKNNNRPSNRSFSPRKNNYANQSKFLLSDNNSSLMMNASNFNLLKRKSRVSSKESKIKPQQQQDQQQECVQNTADQPIVIRKDKSQVTILRQPSLLKDANKTQQNDHKFQHQNDNYEQCMSDQQQMTQALQASQSSVMMINSQLQSFNSRDNQNNPQQQNSYKLFQQDPNQLQQQQQNLKNRTIDSKSSINLRQSRKQYGSSRGSGGVDKYKKRKMARVMSDQDYQLQVAPVLYPGDGVPQQLTLSQTVDSNKKFNSYTVQPSPMTMNQEQDLTMESNNQTNLSIHQQQPQLQYQQQQQQMMMMNTVASSTQRLPLDHHRGKKSKRHRSRQKNQQMQQQMSQHQIIQQQHHGSQVMLSKDDASERNEGSLNRVVVINHHQVNHMSKSGHAIRDSSQGSLVKNQQPNLQQQVANLPLDQQSHSVVTVTPYMDNNSTQNMSNNGSISNFEPSETFGQNLHMHQVQVQRNGGGNLSMTAGPSSSFINSMRLQSTAVSHHNNGNNLSRNYALQHPQQPSCAVAKHRVMSQDDIMNQHHREIQNYKAQTQKAITYETINHQQNPSSYETIQTSQNQQNNHAHPTPPNQQIMMNPLDISSEQIFPQHLVIQQHQDQSNKMLQQLSIRQTIENPSSFGSTRGDHSQKFPSMSMQLYQQQQQKQQQQQYNQRPN